MVIKRIGGPFMVIALVLLAAAVLALSLYCVVLRRNVDLTQMGSATGRTKEIAVTESQLMRIAQQAGMAELHAGILENIYNILNTVNVSASVVSDKIEKMEIKSLSRIAGLFKEHREDLGAFLASDERGRKVPEAVIQLAEYMSNAHAGLSEEMGNLNAIIQRLNQIVKAQQAYAGVQVKTEKVDINQLIKDALVMEMRSIQSEGMAIRADYHPLPLVQVAKIKILQVVVTLIRNACETIGMQARETERQLLIRTQERGGRVVIEIGDERALEMVDVMDPLASPTDSNTLTRRHFSLYYCASAISEMQGTIKIFCEGPNTGALVQLDLPISNAEVDSED